MMEVKLLLYRLMLILAVGFSSASYADTLDVEFTIPVLDVATYHRPYVAVWLETPKRKGVHTLMIWHEKEDWLKDMRQWWRKLGKNKSINHDAASGATRKPGRYKIHWDGKDGDGKAVGVGDYYLLIEAAREAGGRDFLRQKIQFNGKTQQYSLQGDVEIGQVDITVNGR